MRASLYAFSRSLALPLQELDDEVMKAREQLAADRRAKKEAEQKRIAVGSAATAPAPRPLFLRVVSIGLTHSLIAFGSQEENAARKKKIKQTTVLAYLFVSVQVSALVRYYCR